MDDEAAFLAAMQTDPASRLTRHVYADWLEERGDPRHEIVRVCEAMRAVPVWSDEYWQLKARRNELWTRFPIEWLEATGYDGSDYDPIFRDGVPDGVRERWRLIREFTERWHGVSVPDVGGRRDVIASEEARLGLTLPESVREFVAFAHDLELQGTGLGGVGRLGPALLTEQPMTYSLNLLESPPALSLARCVDDDVVLLVAREDLTTPDPQTRHTFNPPELHEPHLSLSVLSGGFDALPTAGWFQSSFMDTNSIRNSLADFFPIHARFADADLFESPEVFVLVRGLRGCWADSMPPCHAVQVIVRRPVSAKRIPPYMFVTDGGDWYSCSSGMLAHASDRQRWAEAGTQEPQWVSVLRRAEAARSPQAR